MVVRALMLALALLWVGCGYDLEDGRYRFERVALVRETCSLEPPLPTEWEGDLQIRGGTVTLHLDDLAFPATATYAPLVGRFDLNDDRDTFRADSSAELERRVDGLGCVVWAQLRMVATRRAPDTFTGSLRLTYSRQIDAAPGCPFACVLEQTFRAERLAGAESTDVR